jgi:two-component system sensor histidine kinase/response regulator
MHLVASAPDSDPRVAIDGRVLRQVAENLVSNAMKYAPGSIVELAARAASPGYWQLRVEDRGPGVPAGHQRELFKPFVRLTPVADEMSNGLGLSLARQILAGHGAQLWYEDRPGGGASFVIELPAAD